MLAGIGMLYLVGSVVMGQINEGGDGDGGSGDDGGVGDDGGTADGAGDDGGVAGTRVVLPGDTRALLPVASHSSGMANFASSVGHFILGLISPLAIACFLAGFGLAGLIAAYSAPWLGSLTLVPATAGGYGFAAAMKAYFRWIIKTSFVSTHATNIDLPGQLAEVNIPIPAGRVGEVTYVVKAKRLSSSAKSEGGCDLKKGTRVMITRVDNHMLYVEPCEE
jgi:membrane protein implicated in regulation of membrane protease activity